MIIASPWKVGSHLTDENDYSYHSTIANRST